MSEQQPETGAAQRPGKTRHTSLTVRLLLLTGAMFAFGFALVPLYEVFCELTGIGGRPSSMVAVVTDERPDESRTVTVEFIASLGGYAPWDLNPEVTSMQVHPGRLYRTHYVARNQSHAEVVGQVVPSVAPGQAARYLQKTECFCFTEQVFGPGETREMPIVFMLDPDLPAHVDRVTLSFTFYAAQR